MKKIFDIIPPEGVIKKEKRAKLLKKKEKKSFFTTCRVFVLLFLFVFSGVFIHVFLSKAEIIIQPQTELVQFEENLSINSDINKSDFSHNLIQGKLVEKEKEFSQEFPSTGSVTKKARGTIRIYNAYSTSPQSLVATTRFVSASGKLFRIPEKVTVPGGHYEKGKLVPGEIDVEIVADQPGEEYNIEPTTFSIPGFAGHAKYTYFYAKSFSDMTGGGEFPQVTEEDFKKAEKIMIESLEKELKNALLEENQLEYLILDGAFKKEVLESFSSIEAESESDRFTYTVRLKLSALIFKREDIKDFAVNYISLQTISDKQVYEESFQSNYSLQSMDLDNGKMDISLNFSAKIYPSINIQDLKENLKNMPLNEAEFVLNNQAGIVNFKIKLWPFWLKRIPKDINKIEVELIIK